MTGVSVVWSHVEWNAMYQDGWILWEVGYWPMKLVPGRDLAKESKVTKFKFDNCIRHSPNPLHSLFNRGL